jgi:hypothetical protein
LATCCVAGLVAIAAEAQAQTQNFTMRVQYAQVFTDAFPQGFIDSSPPYTLCRNNAITFRFRYQWTNPFQEYVYTEANPSPWPYYYVQGVSDNPLFVPAAQPGNPVIKLVDVGLIAGSVNTGGLRQVGFRGRTSGFFGNPIQTATASVLVETQIEPPPTQYAEIVDGTLDMPTRPWLRWADSLAAERRLDIGVCSSPSAVTPNTCGTTSMPGVPTTYYNDCGSSAYCWVGTDYRHQVATALAPNTAHQYRVLGRNMCGVSEEFGSTPPRPFFKTAQACFVIPAGAIPDGGVRHFDAATLGVNPGSLVPNLRVTVHADHADVSDLRISLTKTSPVVAGPLLLMDRPTASNCIDGDRIQAAFADGASSLAGGCKPTEPAISGAVAPQQALASFAPLEGAGTWRLTVEDTNLDGKSGSLLEWCLSADVGLSATELPTEAIMSDGFE